MAAAGEVHVEAAQGFGLGLHAGYYPYCTSGDCTAMDALAMAGISPWDVAITEPVEVWLVLRMFPIRVAGNSGPLKQETTWAELGLPQEQTTVTQKIRRVGLWDASLAREAIRANGGGRVQLALTMLDQKHPEVGGKTTAKGLSVEAWRTIDQLQTSIGMPFSLIGTGPRSMIDLRESTDDL
jgi:adenylosuccinate synthase